MRGLFNFLLPTFLFLLTPFAMAENDHCNVDTSNCSKTPLGELILRPSYHLKSEYSHIILNDVSIYKAKTSYMTFYWDDELIKKNGKYLVTKAMISYSKDGACITDNDEIFNCEANILIDLTGDNPIISNEFYSETGDSYPSWISWGKLNSVIVFEDDSKFKYSKGHVERVKNEKH